MSFLGSIAIMQQDMYNNKHSYIGSNKSAKGYSSNHSKIKKRDCIAITTQFDCIKVNIYLLCG